MKLLKKIKKDIKFQLLIFLFIILNLFLNVNSYGDAFYFALTVLGSITIFELVLSRLFGYRKSIVSALITGMIISLIILPISGTESFISGVDAMYVMGVGISFLAIFLKYVSKKIIGIDTLNPVVFGVFGMYFVSLIPSLGTSYMPIAGWPGADFNILGEGGILLVSIVIFGYHMVYKLRKVRLVSFFTIVFLFYNLVFMFGESTLAMLQNSTLAFFLFIMMTDIKTSPIKKGHQIVVGIISGVVLAMCILLKDVYASVFPYTFLTALAIYNILTVFAKIDLLPKLVNRLLIGKY